MLQTQDRSVSLCRCVRLRLFRDLQPGRYVPDGGHLQWRSGERDLVVSGGQSGRVTVWEAPSGKFLSMLGTHEGPVWGMAISRDSRVVASGGLDGVVMLWDVATRQLIARCMGHEGPINDVAVSPDDSLIASSSQDGAVILWDAQSGPHRATLRGNRRYERMDITGVIGVSDVQKTVFKTLGAVEVMP